MGCECGGGQGHGHVGGSSAGAGNNNGNGDGHGHDGGHGDGTGTAPPASDLGLAFEPRGPDGAAMDRAARALLAHPALVERLAGAEHRLLAIRPVDDESAGKRHAPCPPDSVTAVVYDYTHRRVLEITAGVAELEIGATAAIEIRELGHEPSPSAEERAMAIDIIRHDRILNAQLGSGALQTYEPMPPLVARPGPDGRPERTLAVGLRSTSSAEPHHEVVGVSLFDRRILRDLDGVVRASNQLCEPPPGVDNCAATGTAGQVWVTVTQGGQTLWRFLAVRPQASSGTNGSGVELRYVDYRGKRVLWRAHVPILNVEYMADGAAIGCGPTYRDWQHQETCFEANGTDIIPGVRLCSSPAKTILESGTDAGNFRGMAIYVSGQEVVIVSELKAGWYRYISEWRLHANGTIRPRFGFAGTENPCTCHTHIHHVYWRLDFDIRTASHNTVEEFNDPPIFPNTNWHTKTFEIQRARDPSRKRRWRVRNMGTGEA